MTKPDTPPQDTALSAEDRKAEAKRRRSTLIMIGLAAAFVLVPYLFWHGTWFGRPLTEEELGKYFADDAQPRHIQHALVQVGERITRGDATVKRWYPQVIGLAKNPHPEIRITLAWVLGGDTRSEEFHQVLSGLLHDPEPMVRRNAALSLVRFGDDSGHDEILALLHPYTVKAPSDGMLTYQLDEETQVERGTLLARLETGQGTLDIQSPVPGTVEKELTEDEAGVKKGQGIVVLAPKTEEAWEALRALFLIGREEDLPEIEPFARGKVAGMHAEVQQQAVRTVEEIRQRTQAARKE